MEPNCYEPMSECGLTWEAQHLNKVGTTRVRDLHKTSIVHHSSVPQYAHRFDGEQASVWPHSRLQEPGWAHTALKADGPLTVMFSVLCSTPVKHTCQSVLTLSAPWTAPDSSCGRTRDSPIFQRGERWYLWHSTTFKCCCFFHTTSELIDMSSCNSKSFDLKWLEWMHCWGSTQLLQLSL